MHFDCNNLIQQGSVTNVIAIIILFGEDAREFVFSAPISPFLFNPTVPMNKIRVGMSDSPNIRSGNVSS